MSRFHRTRFAFGAGLLGAALMLATSAQADKLWNATIIHAFCQQENCSDSYFPGPLVLDRSGNLYGAVPNGGAFNEGFIYELIPDAHHVNWSYQVLYSFCPKLGCRDGAAPYASLVLDGLGNLYGTTPGGTLNGDTIPGTAFELSPPSHNGTWKFKVLHTFCKIDGKKCVSEGALRSGLSYLGQSSGMPYDGHSALYGTTFDFTQNTGTAFELISQAGAWEESAIFDFCATGLPDCINGFAPGGLTVDASGNLYGTAGRGGNSTDSGLVFELSPNGDGAGWTATVLYNFCQNFGFGGCADGQFPSSDLTLDNTGALFGETAQGGNGRECTSGRDYGCGTLFKIASGDHSFSVIHSFCIAKRCQDSAFPGAGLTLDARGNLFGGTEGRGSPFHSTLFKFNGSHLQTICHECGANYILNESTKLAIDGNGWLYGTTSTTAFVATPP
jgi:hypothetical protein